MRDNAESVETRSYVVESTHRGYGIGVWGCKESRILPKYVCWSCLPDGCIVSLIDDTLDCVAHGQ